MLISRFLLRHFRTSCSPGDPALRQYGMVAPIWTGVLALLVVLPLLASVAGAAHAALDFRAWQDLWQDPQGPRALASTLWVGLGASSLAILLSALLLRDHFPGSGWPKLLGRLPAMLAMPHAAFAIGLVLLIAPSGWLLRLLSPWLTGFDTPPPWPTSQDPYGLGLMAVLVLKELPFLVWTAATHLQRPDFAQNLNRSLLLAQTLGYPPRHAWWRIVAPQLISKMRLPLVAVLAYSLTAVDVALVAGPTTPPTLAVLALSWLQDADPNLNAKGAAAAWLLCAVLALLVLLVLLGLRIPSAWYARGIWRNTNSRLAYSQPLQVSALPGKSRLLTILSTTYFAVAAAIVLASVAGPWPFPSLLPTQWSLHAWYTVIESSDALQTTLALASGSALGALVWTVAWLEWAPVRWRARLESLLFIPLVLPGLLWAMGLHQLALGLHLDGTGLGLFLAHTLSVLPYVHIALAPAYTRFDGRYAALSASFGRPYGLFLLKIKWPMLKTALTSGLAVGFAVSVAQYLPTLFVGAGRFATVTTEAISLSSGGQRSLLSAFAALQAVLPLLAFAVAQSMNHPEKFSKKC